MNAHKYTHWNGEISLGLDGSLFVREQQNRVKCIWQRSLCGGEKNISTRQIRVYGQLLK